MATNQSIIMGSRAIADYLGVSHGTVCNLINEDQLPVIVRGRHYLTTESVLNDWLRNYPKPLSQCRQVKPHRRPRTR